MNVELILVEDVPALGVMGEHIKVAAGYARNYLIPKKLATRATPGVLRQLEYKKQKQQEELLRQIALFKELADKIAANSVTIPMQAGENDKLYGSVTAQHIVDSLNEMKISVERKQIVLSEPIRALGVYPVDVYLHPEVIATLKVWVVKA